MTGRLAKILLVTVAMAALAGVAQANEGWYIRGDLGYTTDTNFSANDNTINWGDVSPEEGWLGAIGGGYVWAYGFRAEGELTYRSNDFDDSASLDGGGDISSWSLMLNGFYDFNRSGVVQPYVGLGVGIADVELDASDLDPLPELFANGSETTFAWQALIGLGFVVTEQLTLDLGYRYFNASDTEFDVTANLPTPVTVTGEGDFEQQAVTIGLRYTFAPPPPPMPPPPPPVRPAPPPAATCPQSDFVVYFEWDRSDLNEAAMDTINAAFQRARQCALRAVRVVGHTDTSGSPEYNEELSQRRASVVRDALVAAGMSSSIITMDARGESDLARATGDGVREPLNRRTAVTIAFR